MCTGTWRSGFLIEQVFKQLFVFQRFKPVLRDRIQSVIKTAESAGDGGHGIRVITEIDRFEKRLFEAVGCDETPYRRFKGIDDITAAFNPVRLCFCKCVQIKEAVIGSELRGIRSFVICDTSVHSFLKLLFQTSSLMDQGIYHETVKTACGFRSFRIVGQTGNQIDEFYRFLFIRNIQSTPDADGNDPHQGTVAVVVFRRAAAMIHVRTVMVRIDCVAGAVADVIGETVRRICTVIHPVAEALHDIIRVNSVFLFDGGKGGQGQAGVIRP